MFPHKTILQKHEPTQNEMRKASKNHFLARRNRKISMKQMFIPDSSDGWNQRFYKRKANFLQLNGVVHYKKGRNINQKGWRPVGPLFLHGILDEKSYGKWPEWAPRFTGPDHLYVWPIHFTLKGFGYLWWRRREKHHKQPPHRNPEAIRYFFVIHDDGSHQDEPNCNQSRMNCRDCVQLPLDVDRF